MLKFLFFQIQIDSSNLNEHFTSSIFVKRKLWSGGRALGSRSEGRGFDPGPMLDGSGVKVMSGSISTPNSGSL